MATAFILISAGLLLLSVVLLPLGYVRQSQYEDLWAQANSMQYLNQACEIVSIDYAVDTAYSAEPPKFRCQEKWIYSFRLADNDVGNEDDEEGNDVKNSTTTGRTYTTRPFTRYACNSDSCEKCQSNDFWGRETLQGKTISIGGRIDCWRAIEHEDCGRHDHDGSSCPLQLLDPQTNLEENEKRAHVLFVSGWVVFGLACLACLCSAAFYLAQTH